MRGASRGSWVLLSSIAAMSLSCSGKAVVDGNGAASGGAASAGHAGTASVGAHAGASHVGVGGSSALGVPVGGEAAAAAANEAGDGEGGAVTVPVDSTPPTFDGITGVVVGATEATLSWAPAVDDTTPQAEIVYLVYQSPTPFSTDPTADLGPTYAASEPGATAITLHDLQSRTQYYWLVRAEDAAHNQDANTAQLSAITLVSFEGDVQPFFDVNCAKSGCHSNNAPKQYMDLSEGNAYANIVLVPARFDTSVSPYWGCKHLMRVEPGNPAESFLLATLNHVGLSASSGCTCPTCPNVVDASLPDGGWNLGRGQPADLCNTDPSCPGLPQTQIAVLSDWITQGALDN